MVEPRELSDIEEALTKHLTVDEDRIHSVQSATRNKQDVINGRHNAHTTSKLPNFSLSQGDKEITKVHRLKMHLPP